MLPVATRLSNEDAVACWLNEIPLANIAPRILFFVRYRKTFAHKSVFVKSIQLSSMDRGSLLNKRLFLIMTQATVPDYDAGDCEQ